MTICKVIVFKNTPLFDISLILLHIYNILVIYLTSILYLIISIYRYIRVSKKTHYK